MMMATSEIYQEPNKQLTSHYQVIMAITYIQREVGSQVWARDISIFQALNVPVAMVEEWLKGTGVEERQE